LALRTVVFLCGAQILAFGVAYLISLGLGLAGLEQLSATSLEELSSIRAKNQVLASIVRDATNELRIEPTTELRDEMKQAPAMKFAVFDGHSKEPLPGSSPELLHLLKPLIALDTSHVHFGLPGAPKGMRKGMLEPSWTRHGRMYVAVYGPVFHLGDFLDAAEEEAKWLVAYFVMAILMSAAAAWIAVRWSLAPLRAVAAGAARIDMDSLHQRLSLDGVSAEIEPLVEAVNGALERLDAGVARQRRFTANAAHELRTPVTILGARLDAPEEPTFKTDLKRDHRRIRNIVEQLLATARLGGRAAKVDEPLDLSTLARAMIADAALLAVRSKRQIVLEAPTSPVVVRGNRAALESVIANLVDNALRAEPEGGTVVLRVSDDASLAVVDHGGGVEEADRESIFEPFWRRSDSTPGTGLGLAIAKELVDAHGGRIKVEETPRGGATFTISFPCAANPPAGGVPGPSASRERATCRSPC
jgi:signal transduction histidine kinase